MTGHPGNYITFQGDLNFRSTYCKLMQR